MDNRNPAIKRLKREYDEILETEASSSSSTSSTDGPLPFMVYPLEENFFEWHFTLLGPAESVYEGGRYHGRIQFPPDYPFSPPSLMFITPSGRFQVNKKICLTVTGFHPEHWQPAWGVRTILLAIQDHFTVEDRAAIGYLDFPPSERERLAKESRKLGCNACAYRYFLEDLNAGDISGGGGSSSNDDEFDDATSIVDQQVEPDAPTPQTQQHTITPQHHYYYAIVIAVLLVAYYFYFYID